MILAGSSLAGVSIRADAAQKDLYTGSSFETAVESLAPGDTLTVHAGTYDGTGRISITVPGTAARPVLVRGAPDEARPLITRPAGSTAQNTINIEGASYLTMSNLEISGNGDGINMSLGPHHITIEDCEVHHVDVGINFRSSMNHVTVRRNHVHDTGMDGSTGEGLYVGCNDGSCAVSESLIENNWIHDTMAATQGDGIEIKLGSWGNVVRDNVVYNTKYPGILLYGTMGNARNVVERNALWNCGDSGIQAAADAVIRNNLILESPGNGFNSQDHNGVTPNRIEFVNNTIVGGSPVLRLSNWANKQGMILANNAIYSSGGYSVGSLTGVVVTGNVAYPATSALPATGVTTGYGTSVDFVNATARNVYPSVNSKLLDVANAVYAPSDDFNGTARTGVPEAGAYTWTQQANPGWVIGPGFKYPASLVADGIPPAAIRDLYGR
ncbi:MAG TPA: right-handed parallel beta-helix repeat-containing protein [Candidatus Eisenbacteria bacterium]|nr:right-handed parallel beta-helix repeat-containing protein [Candidatus Eisenbacteria bacterium]